MNNAFTPDADLQRAAQNFAEAAIAMAEKVVIMRQPIGERPAHVTVGDFRIRLDYTDASIRDVEDILAELHQGMAAAKPSAEQIEKYSMIFGSYIGETFRRNHGGTWVATAESTAKTPSMRSPSGTVFFPWLRAYKRIVEGATEEVTAYYQGLLEFDAGSPALPPPLPPGKKSFLERLFGK